MYIFYFVHISYYFIIFKGELNLDMVMSTPLGSLHYVSQCAWDFQQCGMCDQQSLRSACAYAQSDQSLCWSLEYSMSVKLLNEHYLEFLSLKGDCTGSSEPTHVKKPHCWKSHVMAHCNLSLHLFCNRAYGSQYFMVI